MIKIPLSEYSFAHLCSDERYQKAQKEHEELGFDTTEVINLDTTIAKFLLPRIKHFKAVTKSHPYSLTEEQWNIILDKIIYAMDYFSSDKKYDNEGDVALAMEGAELLGKHFSDLWS